MNIELWSTSAGGNTAAPPDGAPEGMLRPTFNDTLREIMAATRRWFDDPEWQNFNGSHTVSKVTSSKVRVAGVDLTAYYNAGRRIKLGGTSTAEGSVISAAFTGGNTDIDVVLDNGASVADGINAIRVFFSKTIRNSAFLSTGIAIGQIPVNVSPGGALGTAAYKDTGDSIGLVPLNTSAAALGTGAYKNHGTAINDLVLHTSTGPIDDLAYRATPARTYTRLLTNAAYAASSELVILGLNNIAVPGTPDGVKSYQVTAAILFDVAGNGDFEVVVHMGAAGTTGDTAVARGAVHMLSGDEGQITFPGFVVTPASGNKITLGMVGAQDASIHGHASEARSYVLIEELL